MKKVFFLLFACFILVGCKGYDVDDGLLKIKGVESSFRESQDLDVLVSSYASLKSEFLSDGKSGRALARLVDLRVSLAKAKDFMGGSSFVVDDTACERLDEFDVAKSNANSAKSAFNNARSARSDLVSDYSKYLDDFGSLTVLDSNLEDDIDLAISGLDSLERLLESKCG